MPLAGGSHVSPFVLQPNGPSPAPWQFFQGGANYGTFVVGPDQKMWSSSYIGGSSYVFNRLDPSTLNVQQFSAPGLIDAMVPGPDGNVWWCGGTNAGSVTPHGLVTSYAGPEELCSAMTLGPDGNLWIADWATPALVRLTTSGVFTSYAPPHPLCQLRSVVGGKNSLVWFTEICSQPMPGSLVGNINTTTLALHDWFIKNPTANHYRSLMTIASGVDGNAYAADQTTSALVRVTPLGAVHIFNMTFANLSMQENVNTIWGAASNCATECLSGFAVRGHTLQTFQVPPGYTAGIESPILGSDANVWFGQGVYVMREISTMPSSAAMTLEQQLPVTITETKCKACIWSATSSDTSVATVSPVSGNQFTITAVGSGSATISVQDKHQNVTDVAVTVN